MHSHNNGFKTAILLSSLFSFMLLIGYLLSFGTGYSYLTYLFAGFGLCMIAYSYYNSDKLALRSMQAYPVNEQQQPLMHKIVKELSEKANIPMPKLYVSPTNSPNAFATGRNPQHAAVCCTEGILEILNERELRGVLAHELMHVYNRDILTSSVAAGFASVITSIANIGLFTSYRRDENYNPISGILMALLAPFIAGIMQLAISRVREYDADEDGARLCEDPLALACALKKLENSIHLIPMQHTKETENISYMMIANPFKGSSIKELFSSHPSTEARVYRLEKIAGYHADIEN